MATWREQEESIASLKPANAAIENWIQLINFHAVALMTRVVIERAGAASHVTQQREFRSAS